MTNERVERSHGTIGKFRVLETVDGIKLSRDVADVDGLDRLEDAVFKSEHVAIMTTLVLSVAFGKDITAGLIGRRIGSSLYVQTRGKQDGYFGVFEIDTETGKKKGVPIFEANSKEEMIEGVFDAGLIGLFENEEWEES